MLVTLLLHYCHFFFFFYHVFLQYVLTLYRYILAYRSIFCNDIYLLEVCTKEAAQLFKEAC